MSYTSLIKDKWEKRSQKYGKKIEGVCTKSFPLLANKNLDDWMYQEIKSCIDRKKSHKILDLGCGYGRLSKRILKDFPLAKTYGVDIAKGYVDLYNEELRPRGHAVVGDVVELNNPKESYDIIFAVTTLLYVNTPSKQKKVFKEIFKETKKGGWVVIIERNPTGYFLATMGGLATLLRGKRNKEIPTISYSVEQMTDLITSSGGKLEKINAIPSFTLSLPLIFILNKLNKNLLSKLLKVTSFIDKKLSWLTFPSLYVSYISYKVK